MEKVIFKTQWSVVFFRLAPLQEWVCKVLSNDVLIFRNTTELKNMAALVLVSDFLTMMLVEYFLCWSYFVRRSRWFVKFRSGIVLTGSSTEIIWSWESRDRYYDNRKKAETPFAEAQYYSVRVVANNGIFLSIGRMSAERLQQKEVKNLKCIIREIAKSETAINNHFWV